ncbi:MAG: alanine racemase [Nitrospirota bacterium]|nr:alanine racemase [Nitrospirota bacterium]
MKKHDSPAADVTPAGSPAGTPPGVASTNVSASDARSGRHTVLEVDLGALVGNFRIAQSLAGRTGVLAVVKANAYGHGLIPVARTLERAGAAYLGVATVAEGVALREAGVRCPILLLGGYLGDEAVTIAAARLTPAIFSAELIEPLRAASRSLGRPIPVHVKVDTGMGRIGFAAKNAADIIGELLHFRELLVEGVFTHFAEADLADSASAAHQVELLGGVYAALGDHAARIPLWHAANSAALMRGLAMDGGGVFPATLCRPGIMLYGHPPASGFAVPKGLEPVATWKANILQIKDLPAGTPISYGGTFVTSRTSRIATLPVGYADGYRRDLSNCGEVLIHERRAPVVGRVCMDMIMVDVSDIPPARPGDEAVLMGRQGEALLGATEIADRCGTIAYDILCGVSDRVPRSYRETA